MPVTIVELPALTAQPVLVWRGGVPTSPPPYAANIHEYALAHEPGNPEVFTKGILYRASVPGTGERWLATLIVMRVIGLGATYVIGKTFEVVFPADQYDHDHDEALERLDQFEAVRADVAFHSFFGSGGT